MPEPKLLEHQCFSAEQEVSIPKPPTLDSRPLASTALSTEVLRSPLPLDQPRHRGMSRDACLTFAYQVLSVVVVILVVREVSNRRVEAELLAFGTYHEVSSERSMQKPFTTTSGKIFKFLTSAR